MDTVFEPNYQNVVGFFARSIMRDLRLVGGFDVLFGKIKEFIETELFDKPVDLEDLNVLRNLSEPEATRTLVETLKTGINALTVQDRGTTEIRDTIKLSRTRPYLVKDQAYIAPKKSVFNKIVGDNSYELEFASKGQGTRSLLLQRDKSDEPPPHHDSEISLQEVPAKGDHNFYFGDYGWLKNQNGDCGQQIMFAL
jgi:type III restriction enzyme